jgi:hypothetical protein
MVRLYSAIHILSVAVVDQIDPSLPLFLYSFNVFSDVKDGVAILNDEPTEKQMQVVRDGAKDRCEDIEHTNSKCKFLLVDDT